MGNYLMQSVFELLETVLSYLSNTISFLRVGAFVIVHASMMMVVFTLAGTPNNIVVVILGNPRGHLPRGTALRHSGHPSGVLRDVQPLLQGRRPQVRSL